MMVAIDGSRIDAAIGRLRRAPAAIERELEQLTATASRRRDQGAGDAQRAFDDADTKWRRETETMAELLGQAIAALQTANTAAGEAEGAAAALWT